MDLLTFTVIATPRAADKGNSTQSPTPKMWPPAYSRPAAGALLLGQAVDMQITITEFEELVHMRENIRRSVDALEMCWSCQKISECEPSTVDDGPPVWMCSECATKNRDRELNE